MKKKLLVAAVAAALAAPGLALAQSSVTISGVFKMSLENLSIGSPDMARRTNGFTPGTNSLTVGQQQKTKENRLADDSSRVIFNVVEDLGGGLAAIGQVDMRVNMSTGSLAASGNTHVGLRSKSMGRIILGRQDVHYFNTESNHATLAGDLRGDSVSLLAFAGGGNIAIAGATRTPNIIHYTSPNFSGFTMIAAYSTSGAAPADGLSKDVGAIVRNGNAWNLNPNFAASNWQVGYSYWRSKQDGGTVGGTQAIADAALNTTGAPGAVASATAAGTFLQRSQADQRADRLYGSFSMAGFKVGLAWDKSRLNRADTVSTAVISNRTAWSLPIGYTMGNNQFHFHYSKARDDKATVAQDGAKMVTVSYQYTLSKRTSVGLTYAKITNDASAIYNFFTSGQAATQGGPSLGNSTNAGVNPGEDPRLMAATIRHAF